MEAMSYRIEEQLQMEKVEAMAAFMAVKLALEIGLLDIVLEL